MIDLIQGNYQNIRGWFNFEDIYQTMVSLAPEKSKFCEIGAYMGKSTFFLMSEIVKSKKDIELHVVDSWDFNDSGCTSNSKTYDIFLENMKPFLGKFKIHKGLSHEIIKNSPINISGICLLMPRTITLL